MNTNDVILFLVSIIMLSGIAMLIGAYSLRSLFAAGQTVRNRSASPNVPQIITRRRASAFPGIICALPIHQVKRAEAPMNDIWSR